MDSLFFKEHSFKFSNFFSTGSTGSQYFSLGRIHWSKSKFGALGLVLIISPLPFFFMDSLFFKENLVKIYKFFSTSSTSWHPIQLVHRVSLYGALILVILEPNSYMAWAPWAPDQFWAVFWIPFGPYFGFLGAHHESIWILSGEASWKLKIVSLHGKWGVELMGKLILRLIGALSRAWRREKRRGFDG